MVGPNASRDDGTARPASGAVLAVAPSQPASSVAPAGTAAETPAAVGSLAEVAIIAAPAGQSAEVVTVSLSAAAPVTDGQPAGEPATGPVAADNAVTDQVFTSLPDQGTDSLSLSGAWLDVFGDLDLSVEDEF